MNNSSLKSQKCEKVTTMLPEENPKKGRKQSSKKYGKRPY